MKWLTKMQHSLRGLNIAILRFPLTSLLIVFAALVNMYSINTDKDMSTPLLTFLVGAFLSAVSQVLYERFFSKISFRYVLYSSAVLLTAGYYFIIRHADSFNNELETKTFVALLALIIAFIWIPIIKSKVTFNQSFMIAFKAFFISLFFSAVIFAGLAAIFGATDLLIFEIDYKVYSHSANIVFVIFFPMYFLSLNPTYTTEKDKNKSEDEISGKLESIYSKAHCPKMLEVLLSYIIIPLLAAYTLILLLYIIKNITGSFWEDNLLEPLIVTYSITVIVVYILCSEIENKITAFFRKVFPKLLVPIIAFQMFASMFTINNEGVTFTRYYVILFGLFAITSGVIFSLSSVKKNGFIAPIFIALAFLSIVPPVDAFTVSKNSQINKLEEVLVKNEMLEGNTIKANIPLSDEDKETIRKTVEYLYMMNYTNELSYFPKNFSIYDHFYTLFGFEMYDFGDKFGDHVFLYLIDSSSFHITGHDFFMQIDVTNTDENDIEFIKDNDKYNLRNNGERFVLMNEQQEQIIGFELSNLVEAFSHYEGDGMITPEDATFEIENAHARMTIVINNLSFRRANHPHIENGMAYVFIQLKD